jgi:hypothetical protein
MVRVKMLSLLTVSVILAVVMAVGAVPAVADDSSYTGGDSSMDKGMYDKDKYGTDRDKCYCGPGEKMRGDRMGYERMHKAPKDIYMAVTAGGLTGDTATFGVNSIGMMGKDDMAVVATPGAPLTGTYNVSSDMGYISTASFLPATFVVDTASNTSMPVAGSSAIIGLHGIKTLTKEKGYKVAQFSSVSVYTPGGTVKFFKLDRPVKVTHSMDRKMIVIDAYPSFTKRMSSVFSSSGGMAFTASDQSVTIASLMAADRTATAETIGYEVPAYVEPPK